MRNLISEFREMVAEQIQYRDLLWQMTRRDLILRYKQSVMGFGWAVFMPLVNTVVFSVIFTRVAPIDSGMPYPLFAFCGLLTWNFFASSMKFAVNSMISNINLVTKVYFPREIFPVSAVLVSLVDLAVASVVLVGLMVWYKVGVQWTLFLLPIVMLVEILFCCAVGLLLSMANLFYRDVKYLFEIVLTVWMFVTCVVYPVELVKGKAGILMMLNPMTPIIDAYRDVLIRGSVPGRMFAFSAVFSVFFLLIAWLSFHRTEFKFAENI